MYALQCQMCAENPQHKDHLSGRANAVKGNNDLIKVNFPPAVLVNSMKCS